MTLKILILSFYYPPDVSAGAFRTKALVDALQATLPEGSEIHVLATLPNRFSGFEVNAPTSEKQGMVAIERFQMPKPKNGSLHQAKIFFQYAVKVSSYIKNNDYDLIYATSSKLFTAALGAYLSRRKHCPLYLDIRDIFVDTLSDVLPRKMIPFIIPWFSMVERFTINRAKHVNVVSPGFLDYFFKRYPNQSFSTHTNGIDEVTSVLEAVEKPNEPICHVLYVGTIGEGQGLDIILPSLAKTLEGRVQLEVIGGGARLAKLIEGLKSEACTNVKITPPMERVKLIDAYQKADVLFIHLNDFEAFKKVLPSKLFEYAATGKPIWAGVAGFAARFIEDEIENAVVFKPGDAKGAIDSLGALSLEVTPRTVFASKYQRKPIMKKMASEMMALALQE